MLGRDVLDAAGGARDPGIVDEDVEAAERLEGLAEQTLDVAALGDVRAGLRNRRRAFLERRQRLLIDVADMHLGTLADEGACDFAADTVCTCRHQHAQRLDLQIHIILRWLDTSDRKRHRAVRIGWKNPLDNGGRPRDDNYS